MENEKGTTAVAHKTNPSFAALRLELEYKINPIQNIQIIIDTPFCLIEHTKNFYFAFSFIFNWNRY